jgi:CDP-diacylglycerol--glycerol-3-phosphate 3-phosphatidyltransferase
VSADAQVPARPKVPLLNVANVLTVLRIVLVPLFVVLLLEGTTATRWAAYVVFLVALVTDRIDGQLARSRGLVTTFGTVADPIADKALIGAALIGLSLLGELWWWVTVVVLGRELAITLLRFLVMRHGVIPASRGGKLKTTLQGTALGFLLVPLGGPVPYIGWAIMGAAVVVTLVTGVDYLLQAQRMWRAGQREAAERGAAVPDKPAPLDAA